MSDSTNIWPVQTSDQYKRRTTEKKFFFLLKCYFLLSTGLIKIYPKELSSCTNSNILSPKFLQPGNGINLYYFWTKTDLIEFIGWNIKGYTEDICKDIGILKH